MLPGSTNDAYKGSKFSAWALTILALLTIIPGCIHAFLPDGGAVVIAGLDISANPKLIISVFAWLGATQIAWGIMMLLVSLRYRSLVPTVLLLTIIQLAINAANQGVYQKVYGWVLDPAGSPHHPPEVYATAATIPIVVLLLMLSLAKRNA